MRSLWERQLTTGILTIRDDGSYHLSYANAVMAAVPELFSGLIVKVKTVFYGTQGCGSSSNG